MPPDPYSISTSSPNSLLGSYKETSLSLRSVIDWHTSQVVLMTQQSLEPVSIMNSMGCLLSPKRSLSDYSTSAWSYKGSIRLELCLKEKFFV